MLDSLITSETRVKLLIKFFSNKNTKGYLRSLANEFGESSNSVRVELNRMAEAGLLQSNANGNIKEYKANESHPLFPELHKLVIKYLGLSGIVDNIVHKLGDVKLAFVTGNYAKGNDSGIVDLVLVGDLDRDYLFHLIDKTEKITERKIRPLILSVKEFEKLRNTFEGENVLLLWEDSPKDPKKQPVGTTKTAQPENPASSA